MSHTHRPLQSTHGISPPQLPQSPNLHHDRHHHDHNQQQQHFSTSNRASRRLVPNSSHFWHGRAPDCPLNGRAQQCRLPDCFCSRTGLDVPGNLPVPEVPKMILLSIHGPINDQNINFYKSIFNGRLRNPNGCPIGATFFVSHQHTNYDQVQWLHASGVHELGIQAFSSHTQSLASASPRQWRLELEAMRSALERFAHVSSSSSSRQRLVGLRAPQFGPAGEVQFREMQVLNFAYDSSSLVRADGGGPFWPQTMDHLVPWNCTRGQRCAQARYPGIWAFPINQLHRPAAAADSEIGRDGHSEEEEEEEEEEFASTLNALLKPSDSPRSVAQLLWANFNESVEANRAPFHIPLDAAAAAMGSMGDGMLANGLAMFLEQALHSPDVFIVPMAQALEWLRRPTRLAKLLNNDFGPWRCTGRERREQPCETPSICSYTGGAGSGSPTSFRLCGSCPPHRPTLEDPLGTGRPRIVW